MIDQCEKCGCSVVAETARTRGGCDLDIHKAGGGWCYIFHSICEICYDKLTPEEQEKYWQPGKMRLKDGY